MPLRTVHETTMNRLDDAQASNDPLQSLFGLVGRVAVVSRGGSGVGREMSRLLAQVSAAVIVPDIDEKKAQAVAEETVSARGRAIACEPTSPTLPT